MEAFLETLRITPVVSIREKDLPTMFDLPSEYPEEAGMPDAFHHPQITLLSETCRDVGECFKGEDINIYFDERNTTHHKRPDWFVVLGVRPLLDGVIRRSYVLWQEKVRPCLLVEILSPSTAAEDLGKSKAKQGIPTKWEVYEQVLKVPYYVVFDRERGEVKAFRLQEGKYLPMVTPQGRVRMPQIGMELATWTGSYRGIQATWLRFYNQAGKPFPTDEERAEKERTEKERERAEKEYERAEKERERAEKEHERSEKERERAEKEHERAEKEHERAEKERLLGLLRKAGIDPDHK